MARISKRVLTFRERQRRGAIMHPSTFAEIEREAAAGGARDPRAVAGAAYWKTLAAKYRNPATVYGKAASLGYPYIRGEGKPSTDGRVWLGRFTKTSDPSSPAVYVGYDEQHRKWIVEYEGPSNPFDWREQRAAGSSGLGIRHGDRVTFLDRFGKQHTGRVVMRSSSGGWVLNMGGAHGTPAVVHEDQIVKVRQSNPSTRPRIFFDESIEKYVASVYHPRFGNLFMTGKTEKQARAALKRRIKQAERAGTARNPDDELSEAERLYESFHGREPREILELTESAVSRGEYAALGDLVELTIVTPEDQHVKVGFKNDGVRLASTAEGTQLVLIGGNQDISGTLGMFGSADTSKDLLDLGEAKQIVYDAAKWQTDFTPQEWKHDFGEESGIRPRVFFDQLNKRLMFASGTYRVERPGIVD